ncbi:hypothetical protein OF846_001170 [Rhodotorula toruloides]|nr:hypothetical protein OF846_001170 [Rhodotorula toruloides]
MERGGRGDTRGEQQHRAHPRLIGERVLQLARHERSVLRESAAGDATSSSTLRLVWSEQSCRLRFDKPKWLTVRKFRPNVSDLLTSSFTTPSENASGIRAGRTRETSERRGARPIWERAPGCDPTLAASHGDRGLFSHSTRAVWPRLFVQLLPPLQCLDAAPAAPRPAFEQTSNGGPDFDGSHATHGQRAGLASRCGSLGANRDFLATTVGADSRGQDVEPRHPSFAVVIRPTLVSAGRSLAFFDPLEGSSRLQLQEKEIEVRVSVAGERGGPCLRGARFGRPRTRRAARAMQVKMWASRRIAPVLDRLCRVFGVRQALSRGSRTRGRRDANKSRGRAFLAREPTASWPYKLARNRYSLRAAATQARTDLLLPSVRCLARSYYDEVSSLTLGLRNPLRPRQQLPKNSRLPSSFQHNVIRSRVDTMTQGEFVGDLMERSRVSDARARRGEGSARSSVDCRIAVPETCNTD